MQYLIAALYFLLALIGGGSQTLVTRASANGVEVLHSQTRLVAGIAHVACIASTSGRCHYELFPRDCATATPCTADPVRQFALPSGTSRDIIDLPNGFRLCVSRGIRAETPDCVPAGSAQAAAQSL